MGQALLFPLVFGGIALVVSALAGVLVGNQMRHITYVSTISTLVFTGLGFGVYSLLKSKVPEALEFLGTISLGELNLGLGLGGGSSSSEYGSTMETFSSGGSSSGSSGDDFGVGETVSRSSSKPTKVGDTLVIDKIVLKNEPKLMAEAIRTILAKDEMQES